jgi:hypothetical protein
MIFLVVFANSRILEFILYWVTKLYQVFLALTLSDRISPFPRLGGVGELPTGIQVGCVPFPNPHHQPNVHPVNAPIAGHRIRVQVRSPHSKILFQTT